ncbi:MAG: inorganic phosphate transporter [Armatimonadota bacterium]|nr:inorganic phosphate transporter [Armatimonadota bacterium]MDR5703419.1 inorganic phosphate transporter [Armatimonadota bacterium]MDR7434837.1 inorganic phosphate transporter [Armatimonadota bacterium]
MPSIVFIVAVLILAWSYDFFNGMNDAANAIATSVSTRALTPRQAILLARTLNFLGAFLTTEVAKTIGKGVVRSEALTEPMVLAALIGATAWAWLCTHYGIPISITHSLVAGLMGAGWAGGGFQALQLRGFVKIAYAMIVSPVTGFLGGFALMLLAYWIFRRMLPTVVTRIFRYGQILSASYMAFAHGANDTQNAMGVITAALLAGGFIKEFKVPWWVILGSAFFMGLGTSFGGWRVIRTMGMRMVKLQPIQGFSAEASAATVMIVASLLGLPISTTHVISTAIMGVGATRRLSAVRWGIAGHIVAAWIFTFPGAAAIAAIAYYLLIGGLRLLGT